MAEKLLYHFTAKRFVDAIKSDGLTRGVVLKTLSPITFMSDWQWLTSNPKWEQSWAAGTGRLPYKRNEVRLTVVIPSSETERCRPWSQVKFLVDPSVAQTLSSYGDPENWWLFSGRVDPSWITEIEVPRG